jgi:peptidoglycan hydrolase-like protein with peptidoglycan-binding domain
VGDHGGFVRYLQHRLRRAGIEVAVDGRFGPRTKSGVERLQVQTGVAVTGTIDEELWESFFAPAQVAGSSSGGR